MNQLQNKYSNASTEGKTLQEILDELEKKKMASQMSGAAGQQLKKAESTQLSPQQTNAAQVAAGLGSQGVAAAGEQADMGSAVGMGAAGGAAMGAPGGPVGMAVGAAVGGLIGGLSAKSKQKAAKKLAEAQEKARQSAIRERETANINTGLTNILEAFRSSLR